MSGWCWAWRCRAWRVRAATGISCWRSALFNTLIADADGVHDPASYNDRLLLGLKGTMSEAELHILKARMLEGKRAKAWRSELGKPVRAVLLVRSHSILTRRRKRRSAWCSTCLNGFGQAAK
jgi:hypothetical protein